MLIKKNNGKYYFTPVYQKSWWYDLQFLRYRERDGLKLVILSHFIYPFIPVKTLKIRIWKKWKKLLEMSLFYTYVIQMAIICFLRYVECDRHNFLSFWAIICPFSPLTTWKIIILKKWKKCLEILSFTHVDHKWESHHVWFLRYGVRQTEFFNILGHFLPFYCLMTHKI